MQYPVDPFDLLALIPEDVRDVVQTDSILDGMTPREAAQHLYDTHCPACRSGLQRLVPEE